MRSVLFVLGVIALLAGCGGSDGALDAPPANVAGTWSVDATNAGASRLTGCTGDLASLEGFTVAGLDASVPSCQISQVDVTQIDTSFQFSPFSLNCSDGSTANGAGGGTVTGNSITGQEDLVWNSGSGRQRYFRGAIDGDNLQIEIYRMIVTGAASGACDFSPDLHFGGTIGSSSSGPDVVLQASALATPSVDASFNAQTGICTFTTQQWSFQVANVQSGKRGAKSSSNDVALTNVVIDYDWDDPALSTPTRTVGLGGSIVPSEYTSNVSFEPIAFDDLSIAIQGEAATLTLTFNGTTVGGASVSDVTTARLSIGDCSGPVGLAETEQLVSQGLGASAYRASTTYQSYSPALAFDDDDINTHWSSGAYSAWIEVDLGTLYDLSELRMMVSMSPDGQATHQVWVSDGPIRDDTSGATLAVVFSGHFQPRQVFDLGFSSDTNSRYVQVRSFDSVSWIGWWDIQVSATCHDNNQDGIYDEPGCSP